MRSFLFSRNFDTTLMPVCRNLCTRNGVYYYRQQVHGKRIYKSLHTSDPYVDTSGLVSLADRTNNERTNIQSLGGLASGVARRKKNKMRQILTEVSVLPTRIFVQV